MTVDEPGWRTGECRISSHAEHVT